jgi:hypothetical protein
MVAAHESVPLRLYALLLPAALFVVPLIGCHTRESEMIAPAGRERADLLVHAWATHVGAPARRLGPDGDMTLGETGFYYEAGEDALYGRAWVNMARTRNAPAERLETYRRMQAALNDPRIGGMFERADGYFVLDEQRQGFFLVRRFNVSETSPETIVRDMERLQNVAARWTAKWFLNVAMIMHGKEPAPERRVLMAD